MIMKIYTTALNAKGCHINMPMISGAKTRMVRVLMSRLLVLVCCIEWFVVIQFREKRSDSACKIRINSGLPTGTRKAPGGHGLP